MSEYQYYEFQAVDRPLGQGEQQELRAISTRARITASSFTNHYEWGDLKADPAHLLERYFDLFLYLANWGSRRFALRLPGGLLAPEELERFALGEDFATVRLAGDHLIVDLYRDEVGLDDYEWDDGAGWLGALSPLRADVLNGDLRLFYLLWLMAVESGYIRDEAPEPLPGIAPLTASLRAFAEFFAIDTDLLEVAAQRESPAADPPRDVVLAFVRSLPEDEKTALLLRLYDDDRRVGAELRRRCRGAGASAAAAIPPRTAGELRAAARRLTAERRRLAETKAAAERRREEEERAEERARSLAALAARGEAAWREVEDRIALRNAAGYDRAAALLVDLREVAKGNGRAEEFGRRLAAVRSRHARKGRFIERLRAAGLG